MHGIKQDMNERSRRVTSVSAQLKILQEVILKKRKEKKQIRVVTLQSRYQAYSQFPLMVNLQLVNLHIHKQQE